MPNVLNTLLELAREKDTMSSATLAILKKQCPTFQQVMLRIRDPKPSLDFYVNTLGFRLIYKYDFEKWKFSLYFLAHLEGGTKLPSSDVTSKENKAFLWNYPGVVLELTHNWGTEKKDGFFYHNSNNPVEKGPRGGFGHIAVNCPDVYMLSKELEKQGVKFKKKPDEGRMKGLAFAYDPDKYWVEIVERSKKYSHKNKCNFSQIMLRVKNPEKSIPFYRDYFQMSLVREMHFPKEKGDFSLFFMATLTPEEKSRQPDPKSDDARDFVKCLHNPVIELTHNHGTEKLEGAAYHPGNADGFGFGHVGFLVKDVYETCDALAELGVKFHKKPDDGGMKGLAFALDPDGYRVEIIKRGWDF